MVVFGGCDINGNGLSDLRALTAANGFGGTPARIQLSPTGGPPTGRCFHSAVYDQANNRMIVFAGLGAGLSTFSDVWVLSNANGLGGTPTWTQLFPQGGPPAGQADQTAVYDPTTNVMTVFGGRENGRFTATMRCGLCRMPTA